MQREIEEAALRSRDSSWRLRGEAIRIHQYFTWFLVKRRPATLDGRRLQGPSTCGEIQVRSPVFCGVLPWRLILLGADAAPGVPSAEIVVYVRASRLGLKSVLGRTSNDVVNWTQWMDSVVWDI